MDGQTTDKRADIQGLRGIAVLAVVLYHAARMAMPGGFAGVDIFFVISGYLITRILLDGMEGGSFSLRTFYRHRVRRLFPALFAMLAIVFVAGLVLLPPKLLRELAFDQFWTSLFLSNVAFAQFSGYFDTVSSLRPLLHTWSLGVEEQFYLIYPLLLLAVRQWAARFVWPVQIGLGLLTFLVAELAMASYPEASFYLPTTRGFELLIGALALGFERHALLSAMHRRLLSLCGLLLVALSLVLLRDTMPFPGLLALPPCLGAACLLMAQGGWGGRLLSAPPLAAVGDMSYSLYLWHWPVLVFGRMVLGDRAWVTAGCVLLAFGLAWLSRRFIERPFLEGRVKAVWITGAAATAVSLAAAVLVYQAQGLPTRFDMRQHAAFAATYDVNPRRKACHLGKHGRVAYAATCLWGDDRGEPSVAVWGDSHGSELAVAVGEQLAPQHVAVRQITASACPPSVGFQIRFNPACREHNADMLLHLKSDRRITTVIMAVDYDRYRGEEAMRMMGGLELAAIDLLASGKRVLIVYPTPVYGFDPPSQAGMALRFGTDPASIGMPRARFESDNAAVIAELDAFTHDHGIGALKPSDVLCDDRMCRVWDASKGVLYFNGAHLNLAGAGLLAARLTIPAPPRP